ncbi:hypothetical protein KKE60_08390 [Patescibacteria group bacterium]|nr:hypothetical protein [Patescibacteria group bacterium]
MEIDLNNLPEGLNRDLVQLLLQRQQAGLGFSVDSPEAQYILSMADGAGESTPETQDTIGDDIVGDIVSGAGESTPETQDTIFDDILREQAEQYADITLQQSQEDYNRFLSWASEDKTIFKEDLAKEYAKALTSSFETSRTRGGAVSSLRFKKQADLADVKSQKEKEFERQQRRERQLAELTKDRSGQAAAQSYAETVRNMGYNPAFQTTY